MRHRSKRRDANHFELMEYAQDIGMSVLDTSQLNAGLDLLIGFAGQDVRVEVKDGAKPQSGQKLTESEESVFANWRGQRPVILTSIADVDALRSRLLDSSIKR